MVGKWLANLVMLRSASLVLKAVDHKMFAFFGTVLRAASKINF